MNVGLAERQTQQAQNLPGNSSTHPSSNLGTDTKTWEQPDWPEALL